MLSIDHLLNLLRKTINTGGQTHVHELGLSVHLQSTENSLIDLELDLEFLVLVLGVGLEAVENLLLLVLGKAVGRDHGDLLLLVELLVELGILLRDFLDEHQTLVLSEDLNEADGHCVEVASLLEALVELTDLLHADTSVLGEQLEALRVGVQLAQELHVFVHVVKGALLRSGGEEHASIAAWDGVFLGRRLVVGGGLDLLHITEGEGFVE